MNKKVLKFLQRHRICVLTTLLKNGQPYSASLHYAFNEKPLYFVVWTGEKTRKLGGLKKGEASKASMVIGFSEEEWLTMQMEGEVKWVSNKEELREIWKCYSQKFAEPETYEDSEGSALLKFTPKWWKYTEVKPEPKVVISSED